MLRALRSSDCRAAHGRVKLTGAVYKPTLYKLCMNLTWAGMQKTSEFPLDKQGHLG